MAIRYNPLTGQMEQVTVLVQSGEEAAVQAPVTELSPGTLSADDCRGDVFLVTETGQFTLPEITLCSATANVAFVAGADVVFSVVASNEILNSGEVIAAGTALTSEGYSECMVHFMRSTDDQWVVCSRSGYWETV